MRFKIITILRKIPLIIRAKILKHLDRVIVNDLYLMFHGDDFYFVLWDLDQDVLRHLIKHNPENLTEEQLEIVETIRDRLHGLMDLHGVDFDRVE